MQPCTQSKHLLEGNETRGVGGTNTGPTVLDGLAVAIVRESSLVVEYTGDTY